MEIETAIIIFDPEKKQLDIQFNDKRIEIKNFLKGVNGEFVTTLSELEQFELTQELFKNIKYQGE